MNFYSPILSILQLSFYAFFQRIDDNFGFQNTQEYSDISIELLSFLAWTTFNLRSEMTAIIISVLRTLTQNITFDTFCNYCPAASIA